MGERSVIVWVASVSYSLMGNWTWELNTDMVFCSDVIMSPPSNFRGTSGIIHPEDLFNVKTAIAKAGSAEPGGLNFRIITTYGEVKELSASAVIINEDLEESNAALKEAYDNQATTFLLEREAHHYHIKSALQDQMERIHMIGTWYYNTSTHYTWYSDNIFRIHGLPAQALNGHLHTFLSFIHPDDKDVVLMALDRVIEWQLPLTIEFRIIAADGRIRYLSQDLHWTFSLKGEPVLNGMVKDDTDQKMQEQQIQRITEELQQQRSLVALDERFLQLGHWHYNAATKKVVLSENCYRIHGLRIKQIPAAGLGTFLSYVHPDDAGLVSDMLRKVESGPGFEELEYRITRADGKVRVVRQVSKTEAVGGQLVATGTLQDITIQKHLERKSGEFRHLLTLKQAALQYAEQSAGLSLMVWDSNGKPQWNTGLPPSLSPKSKVQELHLLQLADLAAPEDRPGLALELRSILQEPRETVIRFGVLRSGEVRQVQVFLQPFQQESRNFFIGVIQDVTESHQLQQQTGLLEVLSGNMMDRAVITDENNLVVLWNDRCQEAYKVKKEVAIGKNFFDVMPQLNTENDLALFSRVLGGETITIPHDKSSFRNEYHDLHMIPLKNQAGDITGILHLLHDVTKEHLLQKDLMERLQFIESLVESSVDKIIVLDRNMNYLVWNKRCEEYYGLSKTQVLGKNILEVFPSSINEPGYSSFKRAIRGETVHLPASRDPQDNRHHEVYLIPIRNERQETIAVLWVMHDLTKEYELVYQQEKIADIVNVIDAAFMELDLEGRFRYLNPKALELFTARNDVIGRSFAEVMPKTIGMAAYESVAESISLGKRTEAEFFSEVYNRWTYLSAIPASDGTILFLYDWQDIKEAQLLLAEEHRRLKDSQMVARIGSFERDLDTEVILWSDEAYRIHGLEPQSETITVGRMMEFIHEDDLEPMKAVLQSLLVDEKSSEVVTRIIRPDGVMRYTERRCHVVKDPVTGKTRLYGTIQDITEQHEVHQQLKEKEALLKAAEEIAGTGSYEADVATFSIRFSDGMFALFGEKPQSFQPTFDFINSRSHPDDILPVQRILEQAAKDGKPYSYRRRIVRADGQWRTMEAHGVVVLDEEGNPFKYRGIVQDITQRLRSEEELHKHLAILRQSEEIADIGSWEHEILTGTWKASEGLYRILHLTPGQPMIREAGLALVAPDDHSRAVRIMNAITVDHTSVDDLVRIVVDGTIRHVRVRGAVIRDPEGAPVRMVGICQDVTGLREAEQQLKEKEDLLLQTSLATPDAITIYDFPTRQPIYLNSRLGDWLGYTNEELVEMGYEGRLQLVHPESREALLQYNTNLEKGDPREVYSYDYRIVCRDGSVKWLRNRSKAFRQNEKGETIQILSVLQDVTEEVWLRRQMEERARFMQTLIDTDVNRIIVLDRDCRLVEWNRQCEKLYNLRREDVVGHSLYEFFPLLKDDPEFSTAIRRSTNSEEVYLPVRNDIYSSAISEMFFLPIKNNEGQAEAVLLLAHDITNKVMVEEELRQLNRKLEQKNKELRTRNEEITSFSFVASHDLKEPLRKLHTFSDWLLEKEAANLSVTGQSYLKKISNSVKRMDSLIEDILMLAHIEHDRKQPRSIELTEVIHEVLSDLKEEMAAKGAEVRVEELPVVMGIENQLFYLFHNLLDNALKFQKEGNRPMIRIYSSVISGADIPRQGGYDGRYHCIAVEDNGLGFEEKYSRKIFEVFQRLHGKHEYEGTGMGLTICKRIVQNHRGFIRVKSSPGEGSTFSCYFPAD